MKNSKSLYESIMKDVAIIVKKHLNEDCYDGECCGDDCETSGENAELIQTIQGLLANFNGYVEIPEEDQEDLQICDGGDNEGECHCVVSMDPEGCNMDDGDFYEFEDLSESDLQNLIDYLETL